MDFYLAMLQNDTHEVQFSYLPAYFFGFLKSTSQSLGCAYSEQIYKLFKESEANYRADDLIFLPICHKKHWVLGCICPPKKTFYFYNSMLRAETANFLFNFVVLHVKMFLLGSHYQEELPFDLDDWAFIEVQDTPQQENAFDCGPFVLKCIELLVMGQPLNFNQSDIDKFRFELGYKIIGDRYNVYIV